MTAQDRIYWRTPAYRSAVAHPYHVSAWAGLTDHEPTTVGFQTEDEARRFASLRPEPLIDLVSRDAGRVIACRRQLDHPTMTRQACPEWGRDDFPETRP